MGIMSRLTRGLNKANRGMKKMEGSVEATTQFLDDVESVNDLIKDVRGEGKTTEILDQVGKIREHVEEIKEEEDEVQQEEKDLKKKEDATEQEEREEADPEETAREIGIEIEELEDLTAKIDYMEEQIYEALEEVEEVEEETYKEEERAEKELEDVQQTLTEAMDELQRLANEHREKIGNRDNARQMSFQQRKELHREIEQETAQELEVLEEKLREVQDVFGLEETVDRSIEGLKKDLKMLKRVLNSFMEEVEGLKTLEQELRDEEAKEEKILEHYNDKADWDTVKKEEKETEKIVNKTKEIIEKKQSLESEIEEAQESLEKERQFEVQEEEELETVLEELAQIEDELDALERTIMTDMGDNRSETELGQRIEQLKTDIEEIEREGEQIMSDLS